MTRLFLVAAILLLLQLSAASLGTTFHQRQRLLQKRAEPAAEDDIDPSELYKAHNLSVPIDHFHNDSRYEPHSDGTFNLRYWFDASFYKPGGPVIVLSSGETSGVGRLTFLQKGIVYLLAKATGGIGVILEHRYYGTSQPTSDLSLENYRFLTTDQALADTAYWAQNVVYEGLENINLTSHTTRYIAYGGSYAGSFVAILRKLYPDVYYGAISSSGVPQATYDYWRYYEPIREHGRPDCIATTQYLTNAVDNILIKPENEHLRQPLKALFQMDSLTHNDDFAAYLNFAGIGSWQGKNWDPALNDITVRKYCKKVTNTTLKYPQLKAQTGLAQQLLTAGGYGDKLDDLTNPLLNFAVFMRRTVVAPCTSSNATLDECYSSYDSSWYDQIDGDLSDLAEYRSWPYQYCTQWGFYQTGSGVPQGQLPLISRLVDLEYSTIPCRRAFNISAPPDVEAINKYGGFGISYPRLANVDGEWDPWREAGPHASQAPKRNSTASEPYYLIPKAVHHWDENGLFPNQTTADLPPSRINEIHSLQIEWVKQWLAEGA